MKTKFVATVLAAAGFCLIGCGGGASFPEEKCIEFATFITDCAGTDSVSGPSSVNSLYWNYRTTAQCEAETARYEASSTAGTSCEMKVTGDLEKDLEEAFTDAQAQVVCTDGVGMELAEGVVIGDLIEATYICE